jgi:hypothetical protein
VVGGWTLIDSPGGQCLVSKADGISQGIHESGGERELRRILLRTAPITPRLVARRHVDFARVCSALCR